MRILGATRAMGTEMGYAWIMAGRAALLDLAVTNRLIILKLVLVSALGLLGIQSLPPFFQPGGTTASLWSVGVAEPSPESAGAGPFFMPVIYLGDDPADPEGCICLNNATTTDDGQFQQLVTVAAPTGQNWTVNSVTGFYASDSPAPPAAPTPIATGAPLPETAPGSGIYQLSGIHIDGEGFSVTVSNGLGDVLSIGQTCYYPEVEITGLPDQLCRSSAPVTLTADNGGAAGTGSFAIDGQPASVFDPFTLGAGDHLVTYTFDAGPGTPDDPGDPGCVVTVSQTVNVLPGPVIFTNDLVQVSLGEECFAELIPDDVLEGEYPCEGDFIVTVYDLDGNPLGNTVSSAQVGQTLPVQVTTVNGPYSGTGLIEVVDNLDPELVACAPDTDLATLLNQVQEIDGDLDSDDPTFQMSAFTCFSSVAGPMAGPRYYQLDTLTVTVTDIYTLELAAPFDGVGALYQGFFNPSAGPCAQLIQVSEPVTPGLGVFPGSNNVVRLRAQLLAGQTYTLLTSSADPQETGGFTWAVYSFGNGLVQDLPVSTNTVVTPLLCTDINGILNAPLSTEQTGTPLVTDNCVVLPFNSFSDVLITGEDCAPDQIARTFTVADASGNSVTCTQTITAELPTVDDITLPPKNFLISCDIDFPATPNGNPAPSVAGRPFVQTAFGVYYLHPSAYCNLAANFVDQPPVIGCEGTYSFVRRWLIFDQCDAGAILQYDQVIRVGDTEAPVVTCPNVDTDFDGIPDPFVFSAGGFNCTAAFQAPLPQVADNCSGWEVLTEVLGEEIVPILNPVGQVIGQDTQDVVLATILPDDPNRLVSGIPIGCYRFRYTVTDGCDNTTVEECEFCVVDNLEPVAVCDDELIISIGGEGIGKLYAEDVDEGSNDNCGIDSLLVRRIIAFDPQTCGFVPPYYTEWGPFVEVYCCEVGGQITVELKVIDKAGNENTCATQVDVEDNAVPFCQAPLATSIGCNDLPDGFNPFDPAELQPLFGTPTVTDNCSAGFEELTPVVNIDDCGFGSIVRRFRAVDSFGNISGGVCQQVISIGEVHDYQLKFPEDVTVNDCSIPMPDTLEIFFQGCEDFTVNVTEQFFDAAAPACYKILRTYEVINWCEYNGDAEAIEVSRDADCDGQPGDEDVWVVVGANGVTYYDRDGNVNNFSPPPGIRGTACDGLSNPAGHWKNSNQDPTIASVGRWIYTQTIKVHDTSDPVISFTAPSPVCSINNESCTAAVTANFTVTETCSPNALEVSVFLDANADGMLDGEITAQSLSGSYPNYTISGVFPIGSHAFEVRVNDGCNNTDAVTIPFQVIDCVVVTPPCTAGISTELMPVEPGVDVDGDGDFDAGARVVPVTSFLGNTTVPDCSGPVTFSINRKGDDPDPDQQELIVTCDDVGAVVIVEIYAWDNAFNPTLVQPDGTLGGPNYDFCETFLIVQDNQFSLCTGGTAVSVAGLVHTESNEMVEGVMINLNGPNAAQMMTQGNGGFSFTNLLGGYDYSLAAELNEGHSNGVTTLDLVLMTKHILGVEPLDSPYKLIAADANKSGSISTLDIIQVRKLILGVIDEFPSNTSWRFIDASFDFPDPTDPWATFFPEVISLNDLQVSADDIDFIAVKIGDVNGSAQANSLSGTEERAVAGVYTLELEEETFGFGETVHIDFRAPQATDVQGFQLTLHLNPLYLELMDIEYGLLAEENFGLRWVDYGVLTISWHNDGRPLEEPDASLFRLSARARRSGRLSEAVSVSSTYTTAEAYDPEGQLLGVEIHFPKETGSGFELYQNQPNPFREETLVGFTIPEAGEVMLRITDLSGREVMRQQAFFDPGYHHFVVRSADLPDKAILFYTVETASFSATKKMIQVR